MEKYDGIIQEQLAEGVIERVPPPVVTGSDPAPPPVVTGSDPAPPPVVTGSDPAPPPVVTGSDPAPPPVVTGSDPVPPAVVTGSDPIPPAVVTGSDPVPPPVMTGSDPVPPSAASGSDTKIFYIPHRYVVRESAQTTKMRIVYDASARETSDSPSLNDCLYAGPALQNKLWDVLVQQRAFPVVISGDIKKAFLQVRVRECERDALRFHWRSNVDEEIQTYRFARVLFGLAPSPFLLGGVLECHLDSWFRRYPEEVERLRRSLYVDDILSGGQNTTEAKQRKTTAIEIMDDGKFTLHKWNSNVPELEDNLNESRDEQSFAKQQLQVKPGESKLLGLKWDKTTDTMSVEFPASAPATTKRELLASLAKIYDPLGLASPIKLQGKLVFRDVCDSKIGWDSNLPDNLQKRWLKFEKSLPKRISIPRPLAPFHEPVVSAELHLEELQRP
ncbi:uncharacterized protein LOC114537542 [Dendronephthya gigantea]|uniref:uncharacterized protein LOC114537542 n=1 Tax=Dendronephthya gigantea TaxID=151771 RepID=UPI00106AFBE0|nr:uncharacterized protein LOC114537542 [Dendronephthya gigantea]